MTGSDAASADGATFHLDLKIVRAFARFSAGYWRGNGAARAWALTLGLAAALLLSVGATVALNHWNRWFFDALEQRNAAGIGWAVLVFPLIIGLMAGVGVVIVIARETLQVRWREFLIARLIEGWLTESRFYHLQLTHTQPANPEYRIADDTRWATEPLVDMGIGLVLAVSGAAAFISILWTVGGSYTLALGSGALTIPAYMVVLAIAYGVIMSAAMLWVGKPLVGFVGRKNEAEGDFRFALMRLRDNAESVALMGGAQAERAILRRTFDGVVARWLAIVRQHGVLTWITNSSGPMIPVVPLIFAAPKYLSGELTLGQVTQLAAAFAQVQMAISWIVDNYSRIAEWYASARRVMAMVEACDRIDAWRASNGERIEVGRSPAAVGLELRSLKLLDPAGRPLIVDASFAAPPGRATAIAGETSSGKTALVRAIAGLWCTGSGRIEIPPDARMMIVPQQTYLPLGTLAEALAYPDAGASLPAETMRHALESAGLGALADRLDKPGRWDQSLSNGERQRVGIARALLHRPDILILDDALSALDEAGQRGIFEMLRAELPEAAILTLGQSGPGRTDEAGGLWALQGGRIALAADARHGIKG